MNILQWLKDKFGRIVSGVSIALSGVEGFDITSIKQPLEEVVGHAWVLRIILALAVLSYLRHQYVASQHPK